jgi:CubicO group peptidase (beta-lactamase class C family)
MRFRGATVDENALFQAASLSKAVSAAAILILAQREGIDIDGDIRKHVTRLDWNSIHGGDLPLTLRELLSHTAGATVYGFDGYRRGIKNLPNSVGVVQGKGNSPAVQLSGKKGTYSYSGGGCMITQVFAEDVS